MPRRFSATFPNFQLLLICFKKYISIFSSSNKNGKSAQASHEKAATSPILSETPESPKLSPKLGPLKLKIKAQNGIMISEFGSHEVNGVPETGNDLEDLAAKETLPITKEALPPKSKNETLSTKSKKENFIIQAVPVSSPMTKGKQGRPSLGRGRGRPKKVITEPTVPKLKIITSKPAENIPKESALNPTDPGLVAKPTSSGVDTIPKDSVNKKNCLDSGIDSTIKAKSGEMQQVTETGLLRRDSTTDMVWTYCDASALKNESLDSSFEVFYIYIFLCRTRYTHIFFLRIDTILFYYIE